MRGVHSRGRWLVATRGATVATRCRRFAATVRAAAWSARQVQQHQTSPRVLRCKEVQGEGIFYPLDRISHGSTLSRSVALAPSPLSERSRPPARCLTTAMRSQPRALLLPRFPAGKVRAV
eukprot:352193-Chlamydomonas_euryale.AAC.27